MSRRTFCGHWSSRRDDHLELLKEAQRCSRHQLKPSNFSHRISETSLHTFPGAAMCGRLSSRRDGDLELLNVVHRSSRQKNLP